MLGERLTEGDATMDEKQIWLVLETEPTKGGRADKAGFTEGSLRGPTRRMIRKGSSVCGRLMSRRCVWRRKTQEPEGGAAGGTCGDWLWEVKEAYGRLSSRLDTELWTSLLEQDVCVDLETALEARDGLLRFLMDHFLSALGNLENHRREIFPDGGYGGSGEKSSPVISCNMCRTNAPRRNGSPMPLLKGRRDADYDTWLSCFYEMRSAWQEGNTEKAESLYEDLGKTGIQPSLRGRGLCRCTGAEG